MKKRLFASMLALVLCFALLSPLCAWAEGEESAVPADPDDYAVIDPAALQKLVEDYAAVYGLKRGDISVAYCYLDTGDTWYYNADRWYFSAGLHRVPLMMILAEWEHDGKVTRDTSFKGMTLGQAEESVLIYNSVDNTNLMMSMIGSNEDARREFMKFSPLPESYYDPDFLAYSYFSARYMMDVLKTLYNESERFPNILDCMKRSAVGQYFGAGLGGIEVAQRFGSYTAPRRNENNHDAAIIYTEHPFALVVMTENMGVTQQIMKDMGIIFKDYTLSLDGAYEEWLEQKNNPQPVVTEPEPAPAEIPAAEENPDNGQSGGSLFPDFSHVGLPSAPSEPAPAEVPVLTEAPEQNVPANQNLTPVQQQVQQALEQQNGNRTIVLVLGAVLVFVLALAAVLRSVMRRRREADLD